MHDPAGRAEPVAWQIGRHRVEHGRHAFGHFVPFGQKIAANHQIAFLGGLLPENSTMTGVVVALRAAIRFFSSSICSSCDGGSGSAVTAVTAA